MILNVVFSYNRAMQLDCFISSFIKNAEVDYKIAIIYHTKGKHAEAYTRLIKKYSAFTNIYFYERQSISFHFIKIWKQLLSPRNLYRYIKFPYLRKGVDNFKFLLEEVIEKSSCEYIMFSTDDTFYDEKIKVKNEVLQLISKHPTIYSFRLCLGENIVANGIPKWEFKDDLIYWDYYENPNLPGWRYPFIVDGTIYNLKVVLQLLKKQIYHMPATLESFVNTYVEMNKLFSKGICPQLSCLTNIWLNRVQVLGHHSSLNINVDDLNDKYLDGYQIKYEYKIPVKEWGTEPDKVILYNEHENIVIYNKDI